MGGLALSVADALTSQKKGIFAGKVNLMEFDQYDSFRYIAPDLLF